MGETNNTGKWDKVISFIADEKCLLLIGPEIQQTEGKSQSLLFREKLYANYEDQIAHYHQQDGLFLFKNDYVKAEISQDLKQLYTSTPYDETVYKTIAQIPFHLVISINPEAYLSDVCFKYNIRHRFSYFKSKEKLWDKLSGLPATSRCFTTFVAASKTTNRSSSITKTC
ncbi:MAG: hypothetical protein IPN33_01530 [Saprospiraceae bacterium]|nr:hypothetical protein [Saprospiraceae bacterium]